MLAALVSSSALPRLSTRWFSSLVMKLPMSVATEFPTAAPSVLVRILIPAMLGVVLVVVLQSGHEVVCGCGY